jgi:tetratricopeptide (TPR) repeat protein
MVRRRWIEVGFVLLCLAPIAAMAEDTKALRARFIDAIRAKNYPLAVENYLPVMLADRQPQTQMGQDCLAALKASDTVAANKTCTAFAKESPTDVLAPLSLGLAKLLAKDSDAAERQFFKAANIAPPFEPALFIMLFGRPDLNPGLTELDHASIPAAQQGAVDQAILDFKRGDFAAASRGLQRVYDAGATSGTVPLLLFVAQKRAGKAPSIKLTSNPADDAGYHMLAQALRGDKAPKDSYREYRATWGELESDYPKNRFFLGEAALAQGDKEEAIRYFKKAVAAKKLDQIESELAAAELVRLEAE